VKLTLRAGLLVVPAVVVAGAVALSTLLDDAQRRWLIARESDALSRPYARRARTARRPAARGSRSRTRWTRASRCARR
jgi:hypothetical protein